MEKKKVLFVVHQLNYGGVQKSLIEALNAIDYSNKDVTLYVRNNRIDLLDCVNKNVKKIIINEHKGHFYRRPKAILIEGLILLAKVLNRTNLEEKFEKVLNCYINESKMKCERKKYFANNEEYDIAVSYIQGYTGKFVAEYINAKRKVMFYHESIDRMHDIHDKIIPYYNSVIGVNENIQEILSAAYPQFSNKISFLENYVDFIEVRNKSQKGDFVKSKSSNIICSCGRIMPEKGFDLAVDAARILKSKGIDFKWYFVGDGVERNNIEELIRNNKLENNIIITGMQENPYPFIAGCDIYVQPSYEEAHSLTIVEAMILGRPVVTTATVGGKLLVKDNVNGRIAKFNGKSIADMIVALLDNAEIRHGIEDYLNNVDYFKKLEEYKCGWNSILNQ